MGTGGQGGPAECATHLLSCQLVVGGSQIGTVLHVMAPVESLPSPQQHHMEQHAPYEWHVEVGVSDFATLKRDGWDADVCYLSCLPKQGESALRPITCQCVERFSAVLQ